MKPSLNDISTLKPGMKVVHETGNVFSICAVENGEIYIGERDDNVSIDKYRIEDWKLLEEETPYDWKNKLLEIRTYGNGVDDFHCKREELIEFIEEILNKSK